MDPVTILPPATAASHIREALQSLQGTIELTGTGRTSLNVPKAHLVAWRKHLTEALTLLQER